MPRYVSRDLSLLCFYGNQAVTIRLPDCPGRPLFGLGNHDLKKNCPTGKFKESKLTPILPHTLQTIKNINNYGLIGYKPSTYIKTDFLILHTYFVIRASLCKLFYGQACPIAQPRKKGNCCSLMVILGDQILLTPIHHQFPYVVTVLWQGSDDVVTVLLSTSGTTGRLQNCVSVLPWFVYSDCVIEYLVASISDCAVA